MFAFFLFPEKLSNLAWVVIDSTRFRPHVILSAKAEDDGSAFPTTLQELDTALNELLWLTSVPVHAKLELIKSSCC